MLAPRPQCNLITCYDPVICTVEKDPRGAFHFFFTEWNTDALLAATIVTLVTTSTSTTNYRWSFIKHWHWWFLLCTDITLSMSVSIYQPLSYSMLALIEKFCGDLTYSCFMVVSEVCWVSVGFLYLRVSGLSCAAFAIYFTKLHHVVCWSLRTCIFTGCLSH